MYQDKFIATKSSQPKRCTEKRRKPCTLYRTSLPSLISPRNVLNKQRIKKNRFSSAKQDFTLICLTQWETSEICFQVNKWKWRCARWSRGSGGRQVGFEIRLPRFVRAVWSRVPGWCRVIRERRNKGWAARGKRTRDTSRRAQVRGAALCTNTAARPVKNILSGNIPADWATPRVPQESSWRRGIPGDPRAPSDRGFFLFTRPTEARLAYNTAPRLRRINE